MRYLASIAALALLAGYAAAVPLVLIYQRQLPLTKDGDLNLLIATPLAAEFDTEGRVLPMVWSMSDPGFRAATKDGSVSKYVEQPTDAQAQALAQQVKAAYLFIVVAEKRDGRVYPRGELYRVGASKPMFHIGSEPGRARPKRMGMTDFVSDPTDRSLEGAKRTADMAKDGQSQSSTVIIVNGLPDWDSTALSIARTWAMQMGAGPFKQYPPHRKPDDNRPNNSATFSPPTVDSGSAGGAANMARATELLKKKDLSGAVLCLRDLVDMAPLDPAPRAMLAQALLDNKLSAQAAQEADHAALLAPDKVELRLLGARSWLTAGKIDEARQDLNQALARGADDPATNELRGDLSLQEGHSDDALQCYAKALSAGNRFGSRVGRCVALALLGKADECDAELKQLPGDADPEAQRSAYERAVALIAPLVPSIAEDLRKMIPQIRLRSKDPIVVESAAALLKRAQALSHLVGGLPVPARYAKSHADRDLAQKMLAQAAQEVLAFAKTADEDVASDAAISLGEAFKLFPVVRDQYDVETRLGKDGA